LLPPDPASVAAALAVLEAAECAPATA
jgi:hypothetical protein